MVIHFTFLTLVVHGLLFQGTFGLSLLWNRYLSTDSEPSRKVCPVVLVSSVSIFCFLINLASGSVYCFIYCPMVSIYLLEATAAADVLSATLHALYGYVSGPTSLVCGPNAGRPVSGEDKRGRCVVVLIVSISVNISRPPDVKRVYSGYWLSCL